MYLLETGKIIALLCITIVHDDSIVYNVFNHNLEGKSCSREQNEGGTYAREVSRGLDTGHKLSENCRIASTATR